MSENTPGRWAGGGSGVMSLLTPILKRLRGNWRDRVRKVIAVLLHKLGRSKFKTTIGSADMVIPLRCGQGVGNLFVRRDWSFELYAWLMSLRDGLFVDVGANIGQTLLVVKAIDSNYPYCGFEPNPICFDYLLKLVDANGFPNCEIYPVGLSDRDEVVAMFLTDPTDSSASIVEGYRTSTYYSSEINVAVFKGDKLLNDRPDEEPAAIIKVDVEGAELEVIRGCHQYIERYRPFVVCEILPIWDESTEIGNFRKKRQEALLSIMRTLDYDLFRILPDCELVALDSIEIHADLALTNYVFVPESEVDRFVGGFGQFVGI